MIFDEKAAAAVMANVNNWGVRLMIDLEHDSLQEGVAVRPDAKDARGWYSLEIRDGELWAVDVEWTPDGERRLRERTQRYISPALLADEDGRLTEILNAALVAMPATFTPQDLLAAKRLSAEVGAPVEIVGNDGREIIRVGERLYALDNGEPREVVHVYASRQLAARIRAARFIDKVKRNGSRKS